MDDEQYGMLFLAMDITFLFIKSHILVVAYSQCMVMLPLNNTKGASLVHCSGQHREHDPSLSFRLP